MSTPELFVFLLIVLIVFRPVQSAWLFVRPPRFGIAFRTPTDWGVSYEEVSLKAQDGVQLAGWYIPARNGAAIILLHGHGGNRLGAAFHAEALLRRGYGVLMFDLRAHGHSGGQRFNRSQPVVDDVATAVAFLRHRPEVNSIGIVGLAIGGMIALQAASRSVAIRAVVTDGASPAALGDLLPPQTWFERLVTVPLQAYHLQAIGWFSRLPSLEPNTAIISRIFPRPLLFISAGRGFEQRLVRRYYAAAREPKTLWEMPEAGQSRGWYHQPEVYARQLVGFFDHHLRRSDPAWMPQEEFVALPKGGVAAATLGGEDIAYDATLSLAWANLVALVLLPAVGLLFFLPYWLLYGNGWPQLLTAVAQISFAGLLALLVLSVLGHELLHLLGFVVVGKVPRTAVGLGMNWQSLTPYAHCRASLTATAYRISVLLPGIVLGVLPAVAGLVLGIYPLLFWGALMLVAAGGDLAVLLAIRAVPGSALVRDHPSRAGCQVLKAHGPDL